MNVLFSYFWLIMIISLCANYFVLWRRAREVVRKRPEMAAGYRRLLPASFLFLALPWIVMGLGITVGHVDNVFCFARWREGGPYVLAFWVVWGVELLLIDVWVFLGDGAKIIPSYFRPIRAGHKSMRYFIKSEQGVKIAYAVLTVTLSVLGIIFWWLDLPHLPPGLC